VAAKVQASIKAFRFSVQGKVNVELYSASSQTRHMSALISTSHPISQAPVNTARTWIWATVSHDVPVYSPTFAGYTYSIDSKVPLFMGVSDSSLTN